MRIGFNPQKNEKIKESDYFHQVVVPVYIPNFEGYFKESFDIFKLCLESLFKTTHNKTYLTIVNNGSHKKVQNYLDELFEQKKIHEVIHTTNIGKPNAILKGITGHKFELITITDADVLFLDGWQQETNSIFSSVPKAGVVGIVPQFNMYKTNCGNVLTDNLFNSKMKFLPVKNSRALIKFYDSIGWDRNYNPNYLEYTLGIKQDSKATFLIGSGHFVATYKGNMFRVLISNIPLKMGGKSLEYLDRLPLKYDYWRLTTYDNYAYHMGNKTEQWMHEVQHKQTDIKFDAYALNFHKKSNPIKFFIKNKLIYKVLKIAFFRKTFYRYKKLPDTIIPNF